MTEFILSAEVTEIVPVFQNLRMTIFENAANDPQAPENSPADEFIYADGDANAPEQQTGELTELEQASINLVLLGDFDYFSPAYMTADGMRDVGLWEYSNALVNDLIANGIAPEDYE